MYKKKENYKFSIETRVYFGKGKEKISKDIIEEQAKEILLNTNSIKRHYYDNGVMYIDSETYKTYSNCKIYVLDGEIYFVKENVKSVNNILEYKEVFKKYYKPLPFVNTVDSVNVKEFTEEYSFYRYIHNHTDVWMYFEEGSSSYINYDNKERIKEIQDWVKDNRVNYPDRPNISKMAKWNNSMYTIEWWVFRGWSEDYARERIKEIQAENSKKLYEKRSENPEYYNSLQTTNINYYLNKGYSQKEAEQMLHDRQNTTSLESYIKRYGEAE